MANALKRRGSLTIWFDPGMVWAAKPTGRRGRQPVYSDAAVQTCLTMKVLFGMALRQTAGFVESLLCLVGPNWEVPDRDVPDFSTLSRRQKTLAVSIPHRGSQGQLHLLIDIEPVSATGSSEPARGIKVEGEGEGEWNARKQGGTKRRVWRKVHLGIDAQTLEIGAVEVTSSDGGDAPMLPELLARIPADQDIASVTADGACDTRKCHDAIRCPATVCMQTVRGAERGAAAIIPPRKNAKPWKAVTAGAIARDEALGASKHSGPALWRRWRGYHRKSRAEPKMHCVSRRTAKRNCWVRASWRGTATVKLRSSKSASSSRTA